PAVPEVLDRGFLRVVLVANLPDDDLENVLEGHDAAHATELVDDHRHVLTASAHLAEHAGNALYLGDEVDRTASEVLELGRGELAVLEDAKKVLHVKETDDVVDLLAVNRIARVPLARHVAQNLRERRRQLDGGDPGPGDHDVARHQVFQLEHVAN